MAHSDGFLMHPELDFPLLVGPVYFVVCSRQTFQYVYRPAVLDDLKHKFTVKQSYGSKIKESFILKDPCI